MQSRKQTFYTKYQTKQPHWLTQKTQIKQTPKVYNMVASHYVNTKNFETQKKKKKKSNNINIPDTQTHRNGGEKRKRGITGRDYNR